MNIMIDNDSEQAAHDRLKNLNLDEAISVAGLCIGIIGIIRALHPGAAERAAELAREMPDVAMGMILESPDLVEAIAHEAEEIMRLSA